MRLVSFKIACSAYLVAFIFQVNSQDLFDYESSRAYADYLFESGRYKDAGVEYNRVIFLQPNDTIAWRNLVQSYQFMGRYTESLSFIAKAEKWLSASSLDFGKLEVYALFSLLRFREAREVFMNYSFSYQDKVFLKSMSFALNREWQDATSQSDIPNKSYLVGQIHSVSMDALDQRRKSPFLAGLMSGVIPGSGKIYTGRWKDGLFSLILFTTSGYQAYRIINQKGIKNPGAWIFGGLAIGFYSGNIYGSVKSAKVFNDREQEKYENRSLRLLDIYYGR